MDTGYRRRASDLMSRIYTDEEREFLKRENARFPDCLISIPREKWPPSPLGFLPQLEIWRSNAFVVQIFPALDLFERMTVNKTTLSGNNWEDGISWDELQTLKAECGRGTRAAVEIYPPQDEITNVANMRHLWIYPLGESPPFMWKKGEASE